MVCHVSCGVLFLLLLLWCCDIVIVCYVCVCFLFFFLHCLLLCMCDFFVYMLSLLAVYDVCVMYTGVVVVLVCVVSIVLH